MTRRRKWSRRLERLRHAWRFCVGDPWYWLKCRFWHRFNVVYISTLSPTWQDRDRVLLHASFQILTDFVDREKPFDWFNTAESPSKPYWEEILRLYAWWTIQRPEKIRLIETPQTTPTLVRAVREASRDLESKDEEMLIRLIKVRKKLWT